MVRQRLERALGEALRARDMIAVSRCARPWLRSTTLAPSLRGLRVRLVPAAGISRAVQRVWARGRRSGAASVKERSRRSCERR